MRRLYGLGLFEARRPRKWPLFFHIDLAPAILRFRVPRLPVSKDEVKLLAILGEWSRNRDTASPKGTMALTTSMGALSTHRPLPDHLAGHYFRSAESTGSKRRKKTDPSFHHV